MVSLLESIFDWFRASRLALHLDPRRPSARFRPNTTLLSATVRVVQGKTMISR